MAGETFELRKKQSLHIGVRRVVRENLNYALSLAEASSHIALDTRVHEVRKAFKRLRAWLRLVRSAVGESVYRLENDFYRDASRPLSRMRDAKVLIEAFDNIAQSSVGAVPTAAFNAMREALTAALTRTLVEVGAECGTLERVAAEIAAGLQRVETWPVIKDRWKSIGQGLEKTYRQGRRALKHAKHEDSADLLHAWRKDVKYLRHQLELLTPLDAHALKPLATRAQKLGNLLGEDHDLVVLRGLLVDVPMQASDGHLKRVISLIDARRTKLQRRAFSHGESLYAKRPGRFAKRVKRFWKRWQS
jgi:CHAD domain-containing protein